MKPSRLRIAALTSVLMLAACVQAPPPEQLVTSPQLDTAALRQCRLPAWLPQNEGEAVLVIWQHLVLCVDAAQNAVRTLEGD